MGYPRPPHRARYPSAGRAGRNRRTTDDAPAAGTAFYEVPGVSVAFIDADRITWTRQYGVADKRTRRRVTEDTRFQAGSISKVVTALATLAPQRSRTGKLGLDTDVNGELVDWRVPDTPFTRTQKVTVRGLLSHDAGVTVHGFIGYPPGALPTILQTLQGAPPANSPPITVDKPPGSGFRYSGGGYVILTQLIEDLARERILGPVLPGSRTCLRRLACATACSSTGCRRTARRDERAGPRYRAAAWWFRGSGA